MLPLAYLMQAWPVMAPCPASYRRLHEALRALFESYGVDLSSDEKGLVLRALRYAQLCSTPDAVVMSAMSGLSGLSGAISTALH
ncbi:hypothetical protein D7S86_20570 [Pararobbsia silviterrae]|uniref:Uncharacterized protein n=1 Tax=Pararobbsia silviterrae TaxID=1792498 RepID=A0A494XQ75_9BURK|nr:hypothetical protein D7S86_20570 [Pararobbsia silviterrae]